jgi:hypothetical protein
MTLRVILQEVCAQTPVIVKVDILGSFIEMIMFLSPDNSIVVHEMLA